MKRTTAILAIQLVGLLLAIWLMPELSLCIPLFFTPGCYCCGSTGGTCTGCATATAPNSIQVVITGLSNPGGCSSCSSFNGTYSLFIDNLTPGCFWRYFFATTNCTINAVDLEIITSGSGSQITPYLHGTGGQNVKWQSTTGSLQDCKAFSGTSIPFVWTVGQCASDGSAAVLTSL